MKQANRQLSMKTMIKIFLLSVSLPLALMAAPAGDWKIYPTFSQWHKKVVVTPKRVYVQSLGQPVVGGASDFSSENPFLYVYDREADEMMSWNKRNYLADNKVSHIEYNRDKNYLFVSYPDGNIDLFHDNGDSFNIPAIVNATVSASKEINSVVFDHQRDAIYVACGFGYVVIDDKKHQVVNSIVANQNFNAAARVGNRILISTDSEIMQAPADKRGLVFADFTPVPDIPAASYIMPLTDNLFGIVSRGNAQESPMIYTVAFKEDGSVEKTQKLHNAFYSINEVADGYYIDGWGTGYLLRSDGSLENVILPQGVSNMPNCSVDMKEFWVAQGGDGLRCYRLDNGQWSVTKDFIRPNAPTPFMCEDIVYSEKYGAVAASHGSTRVFTSMPLLPSQIAGFRQGEWTDYSLSRTNPDRNNIFRDAIGLEFDPINSSRIVRTSRHDGLIMLNLDDPTQIIHLANPSNPNVGKPGVYPVFTAFPSNPDYYGLSTPKFDASGTLWVARHPYGASVKTYGEIYYWTADDRRNLRTSAIGSFDISGSSPSFSLKVEPMKVGSNRNLLIYHGDSQNQPIVVYDHKGTLSDTSDDEYVNFGELTDQDGKKVECNFIRTFYEDPQTGTLWVGTNTGLFTFNPRNAFKSPGRVQRIKVARNDGTNLADYLLNGVSVNKITSDAQGRKWFATSGAGLVCTSADGREIIYQFTSENSYLPDDKVYSVCYVPSTNSILCSTQGGIAEYFPSGSSSGDSMDEVKVYPNPVRPDYLGWVTIEGLVDGSVVKIMDASGGLVRELGRAEGGQVQWDVTNLEYKRVGSGVYYVVASSAGEDKNAAAVAKILVIR